MVLRAKFWCSPRSWRWPIPNKEYLCLLCQRPRCLKPEGLSIWQAKRNQKGTLDCWN